MASRFFHRPQAEPIHFFKIITIQNLREGKLMIPNKFVEKYGKHLSNTLFLKTPNGAQWKLNLEKRDGKIWFENGWKEFVEFHSLAHGYVLVFRCERTSHFGVDIFDFSGLEINYPAEVIEGKRPSKNQGNKPPNDKKLENHKLGLKRKDNCSMKIFQPYQLRNHKCVKIQSNLNLSKETLHPTISKCKEKSKTTLTALERANSFKPSNPFFLVVIRRSYLTSRLLNLPCTFWMRHFDLQRQERLVYLQVINGRVWPVKFLINKDRTKKKVRFSSGWVEFSQNNNLKVDDVCTFELIDNTKVTFLVHIFKEA